MARIFQIVDDLSGATLNEEVEPTKITVDGTKYEVDLGSASKEKFLKWLAGEIGPLLPEEDKSAAKSGSRRSSAPAADEKYSKDDKAAARHWAIDTKFEFTNQAGEKKTLAERGRIPEEVLTAWEEAGKPQIPNEA